MKIFPLFLSFIFQFESLHLEFCNSRYGQFIKTSSLTLCCSRTTHYNSINSVHQFTSILYPKHTTWPQLSMININWSTFHKTLISINSNSPNFTIHANSCKLNTQFMSTTSIKLNFMPNTFKTYQNLKVLSWPNFLHHHSCIFY